MKWIEELRYRVWKLNAKRLMRKEARLLDYFIRLEEERNNV